MIVSLIIISLVIVKNNGGAPRSEKIWKPYINDTHDTSKGCAVLSFGFQKPQKIKIYGRYRNQVG